MLGLVPAACSRSHRLLTLGKAFSHVLVGKVSGAGFLGVCVRCPSGWSVWEYTKSGETMRSWARRQRSVRIGAVVAALALVIAACGDDGIDDDGVAEEPDPDPVTSEDEDEDEGEEEAEEAAEEPDADPVALEIVVFNPPSLGAFLPAIIKDQGFDEANGFDIDFVERPPDTYSTEYAAGRFQLGGSASLMSEGVRASQGVESVYLFNVHDFFTAIVTSDPDVTTLQDLQDRDLVSATSTTSYAMFRWFAQEQGLDLDAMDIQNTGPPGLAAEALTGRAAAVQLWEPAYSSVIFERDDLVSLDVGFDLWEERFGFADIPFLGVSAHQGWVDENADLIPALQAVYEQAAEWLLANPDEGAQIIADSLPTETDPAALLPMIEDNDRLGLNVQSAGAIEDSIRAVFDAGIEIGYFEEQPPDSVIYQGAS